MLEFTYHPDWPWLVVGAVGVLALLFASYHTALGRPRGLIQAVLLTLRLAVLAVVAFCLLDPYWQQRIEHQQRARLAALLDTSRSMSVRDGADSRLAAAQTWLREQLVQAKPDHVSLAGFGFDQKLALLSSNVLRNDEASFRAKAFGNGTAIADSLEQLLAVAGDEPLTGAILCSDGIETSQRDPVAVARQFRRKAIPIHTLTVGTTNAMRDLIVDNVQVKRSVPGQSPTKVIATLRGTGFSQLTVPLELRQSNRVILQTNVVLTGRSQRTELDFTPRAKGYQVYEAVLPPQPGEWLTNNNRRLFGLEVVDPTLRVIYMEASPLQARQPEWKYLKDALQSDPNIKVKTLYHAQNVAQQNPAYVMTDPENGDKIHHVQHPSEGYPRTLADLAAYDVVIDSDIAKEVFTQEQLVNTTKFVEELGGGFVMVGGITSFGAGGYHRTVMDRFIPVAMENDLDTTFHPFQMAIPPGVLSHALMALGANLQETREIWTTKFPRLYGYNRVGRAKQGRSSWEWIPRNAPRSGRGSSWRRRRWGKVERWRSPPTPPASGAQTLRRSGARDSIPSGP